MRRRCHLHPGAPLLLAVAVVGLLMVGCDADRFQSVLHPRGPDADRIARLWWIMLTIYSGVFILTLLVLMAALLTRRRDRSPAGPRFVVAAGIVLPTLILIAMLVYTIRVTSASPPTEPALTIRVVGHQWWWHVEYLELGITDANELHIPAGVPVRLELSAADVVHSFWIPNLHGKMDLLPEHANELIITAHEPGRYRGQCAEYCGTQHAWMALWVVAHDPADFDAWGEANRKTPPDPDDPQLLRGRTIFNEAGCGACHRIDGVADGVTGPDLTHMASRLTLGAGLMPNDHGGLAGWIADPQPLKPGVKMPPTYLPPDELHDLVAYLRSLE